VATKLVGLALSTVLNQAGVLIGELTSNITDAEFEIIAPVATVESGMILKKTLPSAPGGRNPAKGSVGG